MRRNSLPLRSLHEVLVLVTELVVVCGEILMAGNCDAYIRRVSNSTCVVNIPYKFWGLEIGETYRAVIRPVAMPSNLPPYSFDVTLRKAGNSARITIPKGALSVGVGSRVNIWVGRPEEYGNGRDAIGRGRSQAQRAKFLEEQTNLLHGCAGKPIHNERHT